jgi:hypothetical protein
MDNVPIKIKDEYRLSRIAYILECMFEYFISILTSGAYLGKLTTTIGISDSMTAILSSIASLAGMFQIISIFLVKKTPVKRWVLPITFITQALVSTLYMIPFLGFGALAPFVFFVIILISRAAVNVVSPAKSNWFLSLVDDRGRGNFQAKITLVSPAGGTVFTFLASLMIDNLEAKGNLGGAFITITVIICVLAVLQISCLVIAREKPTEKSEKTDSPLKAISSLCKNKIYVRILIFNLLWSLTNNITAPFLSTYQIKELGFSMTFISTVGIVISLLQMFVVYFFGRYSMRHSYASILRIAYVFAFVSFFFVMISTTKNGYITFTAYRFINLFFGAANAVSATSILFIIVPHEERTAAIAFNTVIVGLVGFSVTLIASPLLTLLQSADIVIFGARLYAQQILAFFSLCFTALILLYYQFFCYKLLSSAEK